MLCMNVFCIVLMNGYYVPCTIMPNKYRIVSYRINYDDGCHARDVAIVAY